MSHLLWNGDRWSARGAPPSSLRGWESGILSPCLALSFCAAAGRNSRDESVTPSRIGLVAQSRRRRREDAPAELALPELGDLKLAFTDEARAQPQCGQQSGGLMVCGTRWAADSEEATRKSMVALYHASGRKGFWVAAGRLVAWCRGGTVRLAGAIRSARLHLAPVIPTATRSSSPSPGLRAGAAEPMLALQPL